MIHKIKTIIREYRRNPSMVINRWQVRRRIRKKIPPGERVGTTQRSVADHFSKPSQGMYHKKGMRVTRMPSKSGWIFPNGDVFWVHKDGADFHHTVIREGTPEWRRDGPEGYAEYRNEQQKKGRVPADFDDVDFAIHDAFNRMHPIRWRWEWGNDGRSAEVVVQIPVEGITSRQMQDVKSGIAQLGKMAHSTYDPVDVQVYIEGYSITQSMKGPNHWSVGEASRTSAWDATGVNEAINNVLKTSGAIVGEPGTHFTLSFMGAHTPAWMKGNLFYSRIIRTIAEAIEMKRGLYKAPPTR